MNLMQVLVVAVLFTLLTPGILLNLPPVNNNYERGLWRTHISTWPSAFVHGLLFALVMGPVLKCLAKM